MIDDDVVCMKTLKMQEAYDARGGEFYQSKTIREHKYVSYDAQLCLVIAKGQRAPNAQLTHQIVNRPHRGLEESPGK